MLKIQNPNDILKKIHKKIVMYYKYKLTLRKDTDFHIFGLLTYSAPNL